jgi:D-lactate dehydrogenase
MKGFVLAKSKPHSKMKVAVFSTRSFDREYLDKANGAGKHQLTYFDTSLTSDTAEMATGYDAVCVLVNDKIGRQTIEKLKKSAIKLIALRSAGFDNVDLETAANQQIKVVRVPAYSPQAIAEHAVALILTLTRKTHKAYNRVRENNFSLNNLLGFNLFGKTVGIIGTGEIGSAFFNIMQGFGCKVIAYDIKESKELKQKGLQYKTLDEVLQQSCIISIHCPLTPQTKHLFNKESLSSMKKGAMLINTGRGAIINTADVIEALKKGQLGYLGIDVYEGEQNLFFKDLSGTVIQDDLIERLMSFNNVLITPHQGFFTKEALEQIAIITLQNFTDFEEGVSSENEISLKV